MYTVSTFNKQAPLIQIKWNFSPCLLLLKFCKHISIAYITLAHAFYSLSKRMLMSGLHKPAAEDINACWCQTTPTSQEYLQQFFFFYFGKCVKSLAIMFGNIPHPLPQPFLSSHSQWPELNLSFLNDLTTASLLKFWELSLIWCVQTWMAHPMHWMSDTRWWLLSKS